MIRKPVAVVFLAPTACVTLQCSECDCTIVCCPALLCVRHAAPPDNQPPAESDLLSPPRRSQDVASSGYPGSIQILAASGFKCSESYALLHLCYANSMGRAYTGTAIK